MMGRLNHDQEQLFYSFRLDEAVPGDHPVRAIAGVLDLSWVYSELAPHYSKIGRPSIDPVLMIRMLIVGYVFAIRSERALCRDVQVNLAYCWFCGLSIEDKVPDHSAFSPGSMISSMLFYLSYVRSQVKEAVQARRTTSVTQFTPSTKSSAAA
jgi:transposase